MLREAVVVAHEDQAGDQRLVAYVVAAGESPPSVADLRMGLAQALPNYMMPSALVRLSALPLTATGKIDRRALPPPDEAASSLESPFVPPRNPTEEVLTEIWARVLARKRVGVHDNFFELGG